ncbi:MAG TPA: polyphosphate kinase [Rhodobacteraceae bacterium]|nr:polyphosphate kinase [Paracoccaceae bacterium]
MQSVIDHLVVAGGTLDAATRHIEQTLGLDTVPGGQHARMGTHNRLLSLGPGTYAEALAPDPAADDPGRARWFGLDRYAADPRVTPRLAAWALRVDDLDAALAQAPDGIGAPMAMTRGGYDWRITVPEDGKQPFDGVFPALISWTGHDPTSALPDTGARLISLTLSHPDAGRLGWALSMLNDDDRVTVRAGPSGLSALVLTDTGERDLR